jgi:hypothetical protein
VITDADLRKEHALHPVASRLPIDEVLANRGLVICLTNLAEIRKRNESAPRPQLELTPA